MIPVAIALTVLTSLVAVAAAQPVVVRQKLVNERADAQAFFVFDTSTSMRASGGPGKPSRLVRAKQIALRLRSRLPDVPVGIISMTDRSLPNLMPSTDLALFKRTLLQSVAVDHPPPSLLYRGRATSFQALVPLVESHFFSQGVQRRLLVVFTDGEATKISPYLSITLHRRVTPVFVHVWAPGERIYTPRRRTRPEVRLRSGERCRAQRRRRAHRRPPLVHGRRDGPDRANRARRGRLRGHADARRCVCARCTRAVVRSRGHRPARVPALAQERLGLHAH